jgi:pSer/pThr/pTyr-binding forkhead associated (FHA) protein
MKVGPSTIDIAGSTKQAARKMYEAANPRQPDPATSASLKVIRRLEIIGPGNVRNEFELNKPHALIGRAEGCDLRLEQPELSSRHAYLQVISGQIACIDLSSRTRVLWSEGPREVGWLTLGTQVKIGPYVIRLIDDGRGNRDDLSNFPLESNPLLPDADEFGPLPHVSLEWLNAGTDRPPYRVKRLITVVGRDPRCQLRLNDPSVSRAHCSLVLTQRRFWVMPRRYARE